MTKLTPLEEIIARLLVDSAINKKGYYSFSELSDILAKNYGENVNPHYGLSRPLGNIAILCNELGLPLLSVRVHYKNDTSGRTAEGFFAIACELKPEYKTMMPNDVRKKELELTRTCTEWQRLLDYLDGKPTLLQHPPSKPIQEQFEELVAEIIASHGIGYTLTTKEIENALYQRYETNPNSITPSDYCYNRWSKGRPIDRPLYFEYIEISKYRVLGTDYPYNGDVLAHHHGEDEHVVGYCINGQQYLGKPPVYLSKSPIYPDDLPDDSPEYLEGTKKQVLVNTYERNPAARLACIKKYGTVCSICDFDFGKRYGAEFDGMIHVHHLKMVSKADGAYAVKPEDLRPVCPNCHMVLHSKRDGYTIDEVKAMLNPKMD